MSRTDRLLAGALFALGLTLYLSWGLAFDAYAPEIFRDNDRAFDADTPNRIICLTRSDGAYYLTRLHPLFVLALNPPGQALRAVLGQAEVARPGRVAALVLTSAAGSLSLALLFTLLRLRGIDRLLATLWTLVFGLSASQMYFSVVPETFVFSGTSLLLLLVVQARPGRSEALRVGASVFAFGMAVTNLLLVAALGMREGGRRLAGHLARVLIVAALLSLLQAYFYPRTVLFFARGGVPSDDLRNFFRPQGAADVVARGGEVLAHFLLANLAAPRVEVTGAGTARPAVGFGPLGWRTTGGVYAALWAPLVVVALARVRRLQGDPLSRALLVWLAAHLALHSVFGVELFLYSCQWTFAVLVLAAAGWSRSRPLLLVLGLLAVVAALHNNAFLLEVFGVFV